MSRESRLFIAAVGVLLCMPTTAAAQYLDPGTSSMLLQGLIALVWAVVLTLGVYWRATRDLIRRVLGRRPDAGGRPTGDV